jgi:hypothetical protein
MVEIDISIIFAGLSIAASILYYASVLRNANKTQQMQLETRQAQLFQQIYSNWMSSEIGDAWKLIQSFEFKDYGHFHTFWNTSSQEESPERRAMRTMVGYYEGIGVYVKEGLINIRLVALLMTGMTRIFYEKFLPYTDRYREETGHDWFVIETEYLYNELVRYIEENPDYRTKTRVRPE